ncbi:MAG: c-type cytochrome [Halioglobus sp.]
MSKLIPALAFVTTLLVGCAGDSNVSSAGNENQSRELRPADAQLAAIYDRSCRSCHTIAATGSPLTGDTLAWSPRLEKGMPTLLDNVVNGFGGMPPFGMCMDCSAQEFEALITFMASPAKFDSQEASDT